MRIIPAGVLLLSNVLCTIVHYMYYLNANRMHLSKIVCNCTRPKGMNFMQIQTKYNNTILFCIVF